ncbi:MAG: Holliday junction branch migration protein RuvA [Alphaproteobacteria bacterium]|jgi:holliday junction DNA helicase RuvA|nr:Holliday junction branch migration protein RuvA [Alphaproteobacteria bacterium]MBT5389222.1 Holliday junction branch migration protein RuvA [Alphaproteobacteria bacterium]MBT5540686.1 Holliday junction branch migration protein RuvA [Alphaproteobacteria bacterium]
MIAKLKGLIDTRLEDSIIIDVQGVGYQLFCSNQTLSQLPEVGEACEVQVETIMRAEQLTLFGFATPEEKGWFKLLTTVQGVGARVGLALLSALSANDLTNALLAEDKAMITRADGVGPKLAGRIVTELKDKVPQFGAPGIVPFPSKGGAEAASPLVRTKDEALSALTNLGYRRAEAHDVLTRILQSHEGEPSAEELIRAALKLLSTGSAAL